MPVKRKHSFQSFSHSVPISKGAALFCETSTHTVWSSPRRSRRGWQHVSHSEKHGILMPRSSLATKNMERSPTTLVRPVLLGLAILKQLGPGGGE